MHYFEKYPLKTLRASLDGKITGPHICTETSVATYTQAITNKAKQTRPTRSRHGRQRHREAFAGLSSHQPRQARSEAVAPRKNGGPNENE
jgi:hypothetical protein